MKKKLLGTVVVALPVLVGGLVYANTQKPSQEQGERVTADSYICPVTGENLACPQCCELNEI